MGGRLQPAVIAIDGPAASGKSTIGYRVAELLDYLYFDTGVMYRAVTWAALERAIDVQDEVSVSALAAAVRIDLRAPDAATRDGRQCTVLLDDTDVTWSVRTPEVDRTVSLVSAYPAVRVALTAQQRRIAQRYGAGAADRPGIVMVGRDIGTVVMPDAGLKIYMDATAEQRALRRHKELIARGQQAAYADILRDIRRRDANDSQRAVAPLRPAADAVVIDTTTLTLEEVVDRVIEAVEEKEKG